MTALSVGPGSSVRTCFAYHFYDGFKAVTGKRSHLILCHFGVLLGMVTNSSSPEVIHSDGLSPYITLVQNRVLQSEIEESALL